MQQWATLVYRHLTQLPTLLILSAGAVIHDYSERAVNSFFRVVIAARFNRQKIWGLPLSI